MKRFLILCLLFFVLQSFAQKDSTQLIFGTYMDIPRPFHIDTVPPNKLRIVTGIDTLIATDMSLWTDQDDTMSITPDYYDYYGNLLPHNRPQRVLVDSGMYRMVMEPMPNYFNYDSLGLVPYDWFPLACMNYDSSEIANYKYEMSHVNAAVMESWPLLKTHYCRLIKNVHYYKSANEYETSWIVIARPKTQAIGKIYAFQSYNCDKSLSYVIIESNSTDAAGRARCLKIFRTMRMW